MLLISTHFGYSLLFVLADVMSAILLRATGQNLQAAYAQRLKSLELHALSKNSGDFICSRVIFFTQVLLCRGYYRKFFNTLDKKIRKFKTCE